MFSNFIKHFKALPSGEAETQSQNQALYPEDTINEELSPFIGNSSPSALSKQPMASRSKSHWIPDSHCQECFECGSKFTTFLRRHHCRFCGRIFCSHCSAHLLDGLSVGLPGPQRACGFCATNHEMLVTSTVAFSESTVTSLPTPSSPNQNPGFSSSDLDFLADGPDNLFPSSNSVVQSSRDRLFSTDGVQTWHPRQVHQRSQLPNLFPVADDNPPSPRKPASSFSVDGRHLLPDIQTFFYLWFKMTCPSSLECVSEEPKSPGLSFFTRSVVNTRQSFNIGVPVGQMTSNSSLSTAQSHIPLQDVMVGSARCASGQQIVDWLVSNSDGRLDSREKACALCEAYVKASFLTPMDSTAPPGKFVDGPVLYRMQTELNDSPRLPRRTQSAVCDHTLPEISHDCKPPLPPTPPKCHPKTEASFPLDEALCLDPVSAEFSPQKVTGQAEFDPATSHQELSTCHRGSTKLRKLYANYLNRLIQQETRDHYLSREWNSVISTAVSMLCKDLKVDLRQVLLKNLQARLTSPPPADSSQQSSLIDNWNLHDFCPSKYSAMSVLRYVHVKKVVDEDISCQLLNGVAFTGHLVHKHLPTHLYRPRILILASAITYERNVYKRTWLESYAAQEEEYLGNCVAKILSFHPTVLLTGGGISNIALTMLVKAGIAVFCNVKRSILARLAAGTGAEIVGSTDALLSGSYEVSGKRTTSPIGTCQWYKLITVPQPSASPKPVCIFSFIDLPSSDLAQSVRWLHIPGLHSVSNIDEVEDALCEAESLRMPAYSIILKGPDLAILKLAKRCLKFALMSCFNGYLERAYLADAHIVPHNNSLEWDSSSAASIDTAGLESVDQSALASHLRGRFFNLSPLVVSELPFLASPQGRRTPLFDFYFYLVDWPESRRLNDALKQKAVVVRANMYAARKPPSKYSLPSSEPARTSETPLGDLQFTGVGKLAPEDEVAYKAARSLAFTANKRGSTFLCTWTAMGRLNTKSLSQSAATKAPPTPRLQVKKRKDKRLTRSIRDARSHTSMYVLRSVFSARSAIYPEPCLPSWVVGIEVYGGNDLPLGAFLEQFCFRSKSCLNPECNTPMLDHVQRFTQTAGSVELTLQTVEPAKPVIPLVGCVPISMWTFCSTCRQTSPLQPMSLSAWHLSFMKFLDLLINSPDCLTHVGAECSAKHLRHCFCAGKTQATFRYHPIAIYEVCMPPITVRIFFPRSGHKTQVACVNSPAEMPDYLRNEVHATLKKYYEITTLVKSHLVNLKNDTVCADLLRLVDAFEQNLHLEFTKSQVKSRIEVLACLFDCLSPTPPSTTNPDEAHTTRLLLNSPIDSVATDVCSLEEVGAGTSDDNDSLNSADIDSKPAWNRKLVSLSYEEKIALISALLSTIKRWLFNFANDWNTRISQFNSTAKMLEKAQSRQHRRQHQPLPPAQDPPPDSCGSVELGGVRTAAFESYLGTTPDLDLVSEEADSAGCSRKDASDGATASYAIPEPPADNKPVTTVETVKRLLTAMLPGGGDHRLCADPQPPSEHPQVPPPNSGSPLSLALALHPLTSVDASHTDAPPLMCPTEELVNEISKIAILEASPDVYIMDQEITTIIAYTLASDAYLMKFQTLLTQPQINNSSSSSAQLKRSNRSLEQKTADVVEKRSSRRMGSLTFKKDSLPSRLSTLEEVEEVTRAAESLERVDRDAECGSTTSDETKSSKACPSAAPSDPHIEIQFSDATTTFFCRVYYAQEFHQLRKLILPQGEAAFIRSLSRCKNWDAQGGKSGSYFMKTHDERFVVKEVSGIELKTFHDVNRQYFDYLMSAASVQRLSLLARIFGIFHVDFKNSSTGETRRLDVLVMENLFHNRPGITQIYDLKGSLRGRLIVNSENAASTGCTSGPTTTDTSTRRALGADSGAATTTQAPVLLDQNFINESLENPIYLRLHSKNALMHCLSVDTQFLTDLFIMDYSLLVGVDGATGHLVVGIIDYLRKFTLNKRLEMFIKQTLTSVQGPMPTVIMPVDYRERLLDQMERNFHLVPDQWYDSLANHREVWRC
uniref:1-phosphatidylinositol-3-phosphate 5-kinase n=3 Tax=Mesocestoides corti TaxID=53468 RepID=A0A5K3FHZ8_MESCO